MWVVSYGVIPHTYMRTVLPVERFELFFLFRQGIVELHALSSRQFRIPATRMPDIRTMLHQQTLDRTLDPRMVRARFHQSLYSASGHPPNFNTTIKPSSRDASYRW